MKPSFIKIDDSFPEVVNDVSCPETIQHVIVVTL